MNRSIALVFLMAAASMAADVKVSDLPAASALGGTELFQVVQTSSKKATAAQVAAYASTIAAATLAPINNPTFTGSAGVIPAGWTIGGYLTSASAASTYLTTATAATTYQPLQTKLTNFAALVDAAGLLTSDGAGAYSWTASTIGGNGSADANKVVLFGSGGSLIARGSVKVTNGTQDTSLGSGGLSGNKNSQVMQLLWPSAPASSRSYTFADASGTVHVNGTALGTPLSGTATNLTGLPISTGLTGAGTGVLTALAVNTGSTGAFVVQNGAGGTPSSLTLTSATGLPISTGLTGAGTGVLTALGVNVGSAGAFVVNGGAGGTPSSLTLTSATGLPVSTGITGLGTGIATALAVNTGSAGAPVLFNGALGTPSSGTGTNITGIPPANVTGTAAILGANTFTAVQTTNFTAQGTTPANALVVQSTTAATVGAQVEQSPYLVMAGAGWKTTATAASQPVAFLHNVVPVAGTTAPTGYWQVQAVVNNSGILPVMTVTSDGSTAGPTMSVGRVASFRFRAINRMELTNDNGGTYQWGVGSDFGNGACLARDWNISWSNNANVNAGAKNLVLGRDSGFTAGVLQLGLNDPTTATHQTIRAHDVTTGAGSNLILSGGTGSTTNGVVRVRGTTANDVATAGDVGEAVASTIASGAAVALTTNTGANVTSISLTAGDWDVTGIVSIAYTAATVTGSSAGFSTTTATVPTDGSEGYSSAQLTLLSATDSVPVVMGRVSLATTTTVFLTAKATFSAGSAAAFGKITARRRR